jgi:hypothetical protein
LKSPASSNEINKDLSRPPEHLLSACPVVVKWFPIRLRCSPPILPFLRDEHRFDEVFFSIRSADTNLRSDVVARQVNQPEQSQPVRNTPARHLKDTKTAADLRRTIIQVSRAGLSLVTRMILTAVRSPSKSVGFKSLKDTYQKIGHQCKKASLEVKGVTAKDLYRQWTKELIEFFWTHGNALGDRCVVHAPDERS